MLSSQRNWRQELRQRLAATYVATLICAEVIIFIFIGYKLNLVWTGFLNKTLWDWMQLLIIPAVLAIGAFLFNLATSQNEQKIAADKQREDLLQSYLDRMSELLLEKNLNESEASIPARTVHGHGHWQYSLD